MPTLERLYQAFKSNPKFVLLAVDSSEKKPLVADFLKTNPYHFRVLLDTDGATGFHYSVTAIPTTYLIDGQGRIIAGKIGAYDWTTKEFLEGLKALLAAI